MNRLNLASFAAFLALIVPLALADQAVDTASSGSCTEVKKQGNHSNGKQGTGSPILAQNLQVEVSCPRESDATSESSHSKKEELTPEERESAIVASYVKLVMLGAVLIAATWLFFLAGRLLKPARIAEAASNFYVREHWGGFGGESSGWRISAPLGACVSGLVLVILATSLIAGTLFILHKYEPAEKASANSVTAPANSAAAPAKPAPPVDEAVRLN